MSFPNWGACLRQDDNVTESSTTFVERLNINMKYSLDASNWANFCAFIVTPRKDASNRNWSDEIAAGTLPQNFTDYVEGPDAMNIRLNPAQFKVHFASYKTLTETTLFSAALPLAAAGNPQTSMGKEQATIKCKCSIRNPTGNTSWKGLDYMQLPFYQRYYLLVYIASQSNPNIAAGRSAEFTFDSLATTINAS